MIDIFEVCEFIDENGEEVEDFDDCILVMGKLINQDEGFSVRKEYFSCKPEIGMRFYYDPVFREKRTFRPVA